jgi:hypothetical protein
VGLLALAGLVGLVELSRGRTRPRPQPIPAVAPAVVPRRRRARRLARACFVCSALGAVALPLAWFSTRPATDVGALTEARAAHPFGSPPAAVPPDAAGGLRTYSARLHDQPLRTVNRPVRVRIAAIGVDASAYPVGVLPSSDLLEAPSDGDRLGWYRHGPSPGEAGSALIAGHVDYAGKRGVFYELSRLQPGATVVVDYEDGSAQEWRVVARRQYPKDELPTDVLFARTGSPMLSLVTCGGLYDASKRAYRDNVVVFAALD